MDEGSEVGERVEKTLCLLTRQLSKRRSPVQPLPYFSKRSPAIIVRLCVDAVLLPDCCIAGLPWNEYHSPEIYEGSDGMMLTVTSC